jgi:PEGA domain
MKGAARDRLPATTAMERVPGLPADSPVVPVFKDGFGVRYLTTDPEARKAADPVEILAFERPLVDAVEFGNTLASRVAKLSTARHALFARVRRLDRPTPDSLVLVSDRVAGWRLADVLDTTERERIPFDISAVLSLLRQLIPSVALFARHQKEVGIGTIGPERLMLTPKGQLVLTEFVVGEALDKLSLPREQVWKTYRVPITAIGGGKRTSPRSDVLGIGIVVLSMLLGRRLRNEEFPNALGDLLHLANEASGGQTRPLSDGLTSWLGRALQLDERIAFPTPQEAQVAFEEMLATERGYVTTPALLEALMAKFQSIAGPPADLQKALEERERQEKERQAREREERERKEREEREKKEREAREKKEREERERKEREERERREREERERKERERKEREEKERKEREERLERERKEREERERREREERERKEREERERREREERARREREERERQERERQERDRKERERAERERAERERAERERRDREERERKEREREERERKERAERERAEQEARARAEELERERERERQRELEEEREAEQTAPSEGPRQQGSSPHAPAANAYDSPEPPPIRPYTPMPEPPVSAYGSSYAGSVYQTLVDPPTMEPVAELEPIAASIEAPSPRRSGVYPPATAHAPVDSAVEPVPVSAEAASWMPKAVAGLALVAVLETAAIAWLWSRGSERLLNEGELVVTSRPASARVSLDNKELGMTPVTLRLSPGTYSLKVQVGNAEPRIIPIQIRTGVQTSQYLELQSGR